MGDCPKLVKSKRRKRKKKKERKRPKVGDNNGQARHGARKHAWRTQAAWANVSKENNTLKKELGELNNQIKTLNKDLKAASKEKSESGNDWIKSESLKVMIGRERSGRACIRRHYRALTWREGGDGGQANTKK